MAPGQQPGLGRDFAGQFGTSVFEFEIISPKTALRELSDNQKTLAAGKINSWKGT